MYNIDKTECDNLLIWVVFEISLAIAAKRGHPIGQY